MCVYIYIFIHPNTPPIYGIYIYYLHNFTYTLGWFPGVHVGIYLPYSRSVWDIYHRCLRQGGRGTCDTSAGSAEQRRGRVGVSVGVPLDVPTAPILQWRHETKHRSCEHRLGCDPKSRTLQGGCDVRALCDVLRLQESSMYHMLAISATCAVCLLQPVDCGCPQLWFGSGD